MAIKCVVGGCIRVCIAFIYSRVDFATAKPKYLGCKFAV